MLVLFCLRLAAGMLACLLVLSPAEVNPRFFRTHFVVAFGLAALAGVFARDTGSTAMLATLLAGIALCLAGFLVWGLEEAPLGRPLIVATAVVLAAALLQADLPPAGQPQAATPAWALLADNITSALLLGAATTAMLMGHSYLIAPAMSLTPLTRLLLVLFAATFLRTALAGLALYGWAWTGGHSLLNLEDENVLWLPLRWGLGLVAPLVLGWMAWQTARIRSTQSATGILYVVVIFCFLGELTAQLLQANTGYTM